MEQRKGKIVRHLYKLSDVKRIASEIDAEIRALSVCNAQNARVIFRKYSRMLKQASPDFILSLARKLCEDDILRGFGYAFIQNHPTAFKHLGETELEELGQGINSWWTVDAYARILSRPAWLSGKVSDKLILKWARSTDRWWRRAALVSTVALNMRSQGGKGDAVRTIRVCRMLVNDHDEVVTKAMSWALRRLVAHDVEAVRQFLSKYDRALAARVKREVKNKLKTGLKNPKRGSRKMNR